jgi:hypothetical protein
MFHESTRLLACSLLVVTLPGFVLAQSHPESNSGAEALAAQSIRALTHGSVISDVTLIANVSWIAGPAVESGTGVLLAKGSSESRVDLALDTGGNRIEIRNSVNGPAGKWENPDRKSGNYAAHNCWTDAVWFFPALSSLGNIADSRTSFSYIGDETWNGLPTMHLRVYQVRKGTTEAQRLSSMEFYLDPASLLVLGIAYKTHPDNNMNVDLLSEVRFADYHLVNGIQVPFYIQRLQGGAVLMDIKVTKASFNAGLSDDTFQIR